MDKAMITIACCALSIGTALAEDEGYKPLKATYHITDYELSTDLAENAKLDRLAIAISGDDAKKIYDAILTPPRRIDCDGTPSEAFPPTKTAGGLSCSSDEQGRYYCSVAIKLDTGETKSGDVCEPQ